MIKVEDKMLIKDNRISNKECEIGSINLGDISDIKLSKYKIKYIDETIRCQRLIIFLLFDFPFVIEGNTLDVPGDRNSQ